MILDRFEGFLDNLGSAFCILARKLASRAYGTRFLFLEQLLGYGEFLACFVQHAIYRALGASRLSSAVVLLASAWSLRLILWGVR